MSTAKGTVINSRDKKEKKGREFLEQYIVELKYRSKQKQQINSFWPKKQVLSMCNQLTIGVVFYVGLQCWTCQIFHICINEVLGSGRMPKCHKPCYE